MMNISFPCRVVLNSGDVTASIGNLNSTGNTQEYLASLYISKMNMFVENIRVYMYVVIYPMRLPFRN